MSRTDAVRSELDTEAAICHCDDRQGGGLDIQHNARSWKHHSVLWHHILPSTLWLSVMLYSTKITSKFYTRVSARASERFTPPEGCASLIARRIRDALSRRYLLRSITPIAST